MSHYCNIFLEAKAADERFEEEKAKAEKCSPEFEKMVKEKLR